MYNHVFYSSCRTNLRLYIILKVAFLISFWQKKCSNPYIPTNTTPCATLFVANLGPSCNEQELIQVFSRSVYKNHVKYFIVCKICISWSCICLYLHLLLGSLDFWNSRCRAHMELLFHLLISRFFFLCLLISCYAFNNYVDRSSLFHCMLLHVSTFNFK